MMSRLCRLAFRRVSLGLVTAVFMVGCVAGPALAQSKDILAFGAASLKNALDEANALYLRQISRKVVVS
jgi:ABC-type molybdate transport system substrate-binding protein